VTISIRERLLFTVIALVGAFFITRGLIAGPGFTDVFYHLNAANRLVAGQGLTDTYLWTYIGAPDTLPVPSHLYWMPFTSLSAAFGMWLFNAPGDYFAAQFPLTLMFAGTICVGFWLGGRLGQTRRHAWIAGLLTLFSGFYTRFWGAVDTFAPYALVGSLCLVFIGLAVQRPESETSNRRVLLFFALAGAMSALAHLTRADGVLLLLVGWAVILWPFGKGMSIRQRMFSLAVITATYLLVMLPWFSRNLNAIGTPMPLGGTQSIWFTEYNDIFNYPPESSPTTFFADGLSTFFATRWEAFAGNVGLFSGNFGTFFAVEGLVVMTPLMLVGLWKRRKLPFLRGFWLYALGVHLAMTLIFPYPGYRGGLLHSAAALIPWWATLGVLGLDDCVDWVAKRRRNWNAGVAKIIFSAALLAVAIFLSVNIAQRNYVEPVQTPGIYRQLMETLPSDARVMINDPGQLYYFTGFSGVVLPNESPEAILDIARKYQVGYVLFEEVSPENTAAAPAKLWSIFVDPPDFLTLMPLDNPGVRLYAIHY
jgi:hypothetical protein